MSKQKELKAFKVQDRRPLRRSEIYVDPVQNARRTMYRKPIEEMVQSIKDFGMLHNVVVRPISVPGRPPFQLVAGYRRLAAADELGLVVIPCLIEEADDDRAHDIMMVENVIRENVDPWDLGDAVAALRLQGLTYPDIAERLSLAYDQSFTMERLQKLAETVTKLSPELKAVWMKGAKEFDEDEAYRASLLPPNEQHDLLMSLYGGEEKPFSLPRQEPGKKRKAGRPKLRSIERALGSLKQHDFDDHDDGLQNHDQRRAARLVLQWVLGARTTSPIKFRPKKNQPPKEETSS